jgi:hemerythrin-like domain-containing protein
MSKLIEELKQEHSELVSMLSKVTEFGIGSKEREDILFSAKNVLLAHLKKEDAELYPFLRKKTENDKNLELILDMFTRDMETVSKTVLAFFDKYSQGDSHSELEFAANFGRLLGLLEVRIQKEENILYKEYERLKRLTK